jgi:hypothetical protein
MLWHDKESLRKQTDLLRAHSWRTKTRWPRFSGSPVVVLLAAAALLLSVCALADEPVDEDGTATIYTIDDGVYAVENRDGSTDYIYDLNDGIQVRENADGTRQTCYVVDEDVTTCEAE